jgi:hypothetical protein
MCSRGQTGWLWAVSGTAIAEAVEACDRGTRAAVAAQSGDVTVDRREFVVLVQRCLDLVGRILRKQFEPVVPLEEYGVAEVSALRSVIGRLVYEDADAGYQSVL